jgi:hypothetical protein
MAEAGCLYHTSWIVDDQPWPINVHDGQKFIFVPYTGQTNDRRDARLEPRGGLLPALTFDISIDKVKWGNIIKNGSCVQRSSNNTPRRIVYWM